MDTGMGTVICTLLFRFEQHPKHLSQNKHVERHKKKENDTDIGILHIYVSKCVAYGTMGGTGIGTGTWQ